MSALTAGTASEDEVERLARAVLYEGYLLYPYHRDALKNRSRFTFGDLEPGALWQAECLVVGARARVDVSVRFLEDTAERRVEVERAAVAELTAGETAGETVLVSALGLGAGVTRLTVRMTNTTGARILATQALLRITDGEFVSLTDPPQAFREQAAGCRNIGTWPVLVGAEGARDRIFAAPIILPDYPRVAPESPGDLFDGTETDELLTLSILALPDAERHAITDPRARELLERTTALGQDELLALHGRLERPIQVGDRVRLRPNRRADIMDSLLAGKAATVVAVEEDLEGVLHIGVTVDDDPGADLGEFGHRFFFRIDEVERR
ncbi:hypothetical protein SAMN02745121_06657 [Nannocystis exedens]|uniref:Uncharacterized protein n=1 Tax=Nannocystis exedens TaxID=54 RepID=A0A1I2FFS0_9BACT|nr:hypothetical protein [Nannocystis exedens]PCC70435.1 hypothetical protein NAEX_03478 [Nannocystis exedens]SFF04354.1 hypothetical protein SAMN02745121_06657 [Nannocystis exedens]